MSRHRIIINIILENNHKSFNVGLSDLIKDIKLKIQDKKGFPVKFQQLYFNTQLLENDKTLSNYHILKDSNLDLILKSEGKILIFIQPVSGQKITFSVNKNTKIEKLIRIIQKKEIINTEFKLKYNNILLEGGKTLEDYKIANNSILDLSLNKSFEFIKIYIYFDKRKIFQNIINGLSKIKDIKTKLSAIINIPYWGLVLYIDDEILDDNKIINLDIEKNHTFKLFQKTFFIKSENENKKENKLSSKNFINLRMAIEPDKCNNLLQPHNIKDNDDDQILDNNKKLCNDYGINIFIKNTYATYTLLFDVSKTVKEFKKALIHKKHIFVDTLKFGEKILQDEFTLAEYNVQNNSTIFLL